MPLGVWASTIAASPKNTGWYSRTLLDVMNDGTATNSTAASTEPPKVDAPAATSTVTHTSDWVKSKLAGLTLLVRLPSRPPAMAARNPLRQNTSTREAVGLMPRLSTAVGESAMPAAGGRAG